MCVQYGNIITNYVEILAITLVVWPESHETLNMIAHFENVFWTYLKYSELDIFYCKYVTSYDTMRRFYIVSIVFEFLMPVSIMIKTAGMKILSSGPILAKLAVDL